MLTRLTTVPTPEFGGYGGRSETLTDRTAPAPTPWNTDSSDVIEFQHPQSAIDSAIARAPHTSTQLNQFIGKLISEGPKLDWTQWSSNLETRIDGHPVRLSRDVRTIPDYPLFDLQVFPKSRFFGAFSAPLFTLEDVGPDMAPAGPQLHRLFNTALKTLPELKTSIPEEDQDFRFFQIHDTPLTLAFPKNGLDRKHPELAQLPEDVSWALLIREKRPREDNPFAKEGLKPPADFKGYIDEQGFHPLKGAEKALDKDSFNQVLNRVGITMDTLINKGRKLHEESQSRWWFFKHH